MREVCAALCQTRGPRFELTCWSEGVASRYSRYLVAPRGDGEADPSDSGKRCRTEEGGGGTGRFPLEAGNCIGDDEGDAAPEIKDGKTGATKI